MQGGELQERGLRLAVPPVEATGTVGSLALTKPDSDPIDNDANDGGELTSSQPQGRGSVEIPVLRPGRPQRPPESQPTEVVPNDEFNNILLNQVKVEAMSRTDPRLTPGQPYRVIEPQPAPQEGKSAELAATAATAQRLRTNPAEVGLRAPYVPNRDVVPAPAVERGALTEAENARGLQRAQEASEPSLVDEVRAEQYAAGRELAEQRHAELLEKHPKLKTLVSFLNGLEGGDRFRALAKQVGNELHIDVHEVVNGVVKPEPMDAQTFEKLMGPERLAAIEAIKRGNVTGEMLAGARGERAEATSVKEKIGRWLGKLHERISAHERDERALFKQILTKALAVNPAVAASTFAEGQTLVSANHGERERVASDREAQLTTVRHKFDEVRGETKIELEDEPVLDAETSLRRERVRGQAEVLSLLHHSLNQARGAEPEAA